MDERARRDAVAPGEEDSGHPIAADCAAPPTSSASAETSAPPLSHAERRFIVMSMMVPVFVGSVDQSILASSLPTIGRDLGDTHDLPWLITAYLTPLKFELLLFLFGIGFGPTPPLTQVALQNTVANHHLGSAVAAMNFTRTLGGTILIAVFGAIVLSGAPLDALPSRNLSGTSVKGFGVVFVAAAVTLVVALVAMLFLEEKPLRATLPSPPR